MMAGLECYKTGVREQECFINDDKKKRKNRALKRSAQTEKDRKRGLVASLQL